MNFILFSLKQTIPKLRWGKFRVKERWEKDETDFFHYEMRNQRKKNENLSI